MIVILVLAGFRSRVDGKCYLSQTWASQSDHCGGKTLPACTVSACPSDSKLPKKNLRSNSDLMGNITFNSHLEKPRQKIWRSAPDHLSFGPRFCRHDRRLSTFGTRVSHRSPRALHPAPSSGGEATAHCVWHRECYSGGFIPSNLP